MTLKSREVFNQFVNQKCHEHAYLRKQVPPPHILDSALPFRCLDQMVSEVKIMEGLKQRGQGEDSMATTNMKLNKA